MPYRNTNYPWYKYGFNGKESDMDFRGFGVISDYGARIYNARLGKFLSVDPMTKNYATLTPYQYASNRPIEGIDIDGLEFYKNNDCYINMSVTYDSKLRQITNVTTSYRAYELRTNTLLSERILPGKLEEAVDANSSLVKSVPFFSKNPLIKNINEGSMEDLIELPPGSKTENYGTAIIPYNNATYREQQKTKKFVTDGVAGRNDATNGVIAAIQIAGSILEKAGQEYVNSYIRAANGVQSDKALQTADIMQLAIKNHKIDSYLNESSLNGIANYLLHGKEPQKWVVFNGVSSLVPDKALLKAAQNLWEDYKNASNLKEIQKLQNGSKEKIDNTGRNNGGGY